MVGNQSNPLENKFYRGKNPSYLESTSISSSGHMWWAESWRLSGVWRRRWLRLARWLLAPLYAWDVPLFCLFGHQLSVQTQHVLLLITIRNTSLYFLDSIIQIFSHFNISKIIMSLKIVINKLFYNRCTHLRYFSFFP